MLDVEIHLSDWVFNAIESKEVLTLNRDYFRLRKPVERRMYDIGRNHCGAKAQWNISLDLLYKKCGSNSSKEEFKRLTKTIIEQDITHNHIPDYKIRFGDPTKYPDPTEMVVYINRQVEQKEREKEASLKLGYGFPTLKPETYEQARAVAPSLDVYALEEDWRGFWIDKGKPELKSPDAAFIGFCKKRYEMEKDLFY